MQLFNWKFQNEMKFPFQIFVLFCLLILIFLLILLLGMLALSLIFIPVYICVRRKWLCSLVPLHRISERKNVSNISCRPFNI